METETNSQKIDGKERMREREGERDTEREREVGWGG